MQDAADIPLTAAASWRESLLRSKAQIANGETVALMPVLDELRNAADRLEAEINQSARETGPTASA